MKTHKKQKLLYYFISILKTLCGIVVLHNRYTMQTKKAVPLMVFNSTSSRMVRFTVNFQNAPFPPMTHEKVWFKVLSVFPWSKSCFTVWEKEYPCIIQGFG